MIDLDLPELDCFEFKTTHFALGELPNLPKLEKNQKHAIYGISLRNTSDSPVRIIGRKWICRSGNHETSVTEGDTIFNSRPLLEPGQLFAVSGFFPVVPPAKISLTLLGRDNEGHIFRTRAYTLNP